MNWLLKLLCHRGREYRGDDFSVSIEPIFRDAVSIIYTRQGERLKLGGERIGKKWEGIDVRLPANLEDAQVTQIVSDLETAFVALRYGYVIARKMGVDIVPETERQAALADYARLAMRSRFCQMGKFARPGGQVRLVKMWKHCEFIEPSNR